MTGVPDPRQSLLVGVEGPLVTVYGPPGVGTSTLARAAFPDHVVVDAADATAASLGARPPGPQLWDGVEPATAAEAWSAELGTVVVASTGRTGLAHEQAVRIDPLPDTVIEEMLADRGPPVPGLAAACFGLPGLVARAHELHLLLGRLPRASDWLRLGPQRRQRSPRQALERQVRGVPSAEPLLPALAAFRGPFLLGDLEPVVPVDPLPLLSEALDAGLVVPHEAGGLVVPPLLRALLDERPDAAATRQRMLAALAAACPGFVEALERDGTTAPVGHRTADLLAAAEARVDGWTAALWLATLQRPTEVPRTVLSRARDDASDDPLVIRSLARHFRAAGALTEAEELLRRVDDAGARRELGALLHRTRRLDEAVALYQADQGRSRRDDAVRMANIAAIAHDRGELEEAERAYGRALRELTAHSDERSAGLLASNLGALQAERGDVDSARATLGRAVRTLRAAGEPRLWAIATGNLAWLEARAGDLERGQRLLLRALEDGVPDERTAATLWMRLGALHACQGALSPAATAFDEVDALLHGSEDRFAIALADLFRGFLLLARGRRLEVVAAMERGRGGLLATSDDARSALTWLEELLVRRPGQSIVVGDRGRYVRTPDGQPHTVSNGAAARILVGLAERWSPQGRGLDLDQLFALGWPGERAVPAAQRNRVHVALSALRKAGLKPFIVRDEVGHLLDPAVPVLRGE